MVNYHSRYEIARCEARNLNPLVFPFVTIAIILILAVLAISDLQYRVKELERRLSIIENKDFVNGK